MTQGTEFLGQNDNSFPLFQKRMTRYDIIIYVIEQKVQKFR